MSACHRAPLRPQPDANLEHRLLMGIEYGRDAGGQGTAEEHKAERSSALLVYSRHTYPDIDLRWNGATGYTHKDGTPY